MPLSKPIPATLPADLVSLHLWDWSGEAEAARPAGIFGEQIGERLPASDHPVTFPAHEGDPVAVHHVAWFEGKPMMWGGPLRLCEGDTYTAPFPCAGEIVNATSAGA